MRIVLTLTARDEADLIDTHLRYHFEAGVDFVIATDHRSSDGTTELLESYERDGRLHLIRRGEQAFRQAEWVNEMARLAATRFDADWVINADADEFWWPHGGTLREVFASTPAAYGAIRGIWRHFVPRPETDEPFYERMVVRREPARDPVDPYCANAKVVHRAVPDIVVSLGNHDASASGVVLLRDWVPFEILHFPIRSREQLERKYVTGRSSRLLAGPEMVPRHMTQMAEELRRGADEVYRRLVVDGVELEVGLASGFLSVDTRLRDWLHGDSTATRSVADDVEFAEEVDAMFSLDSSVRLVERVNTFEQRLAAVEAKGGR